ncbi:MAG: hypothetical protein J0H04_00650, partial [Hyphomicrobium denitrificans]|nr:hypothetical protein [Hyphomicrobium denitrificans]
GVLRRHRHVQVRIHGVQALDRRDQARGDRRAVHDAGDLLQVDVDAVQPVRIDGLRGLGLANALRAYLGNS